MKIKVTIDRDCCDDRYADLVKYSGKKKNPNVNYLFCKHCGQIWHETRKMDASGSSSDCLEPITQGEAP